MLLCWVSLLFLILPFIIGKVVVMNLEKVTLKRETTKPDSKSSVVGNAVINRQPLTNYYDEYYRTAVTLGTPPQTFSMLIDTSTNVFWVVDPTCSSQGCQANIGNFRRTPFNSERSITFRSLTTLVAYTNSWYLTSYGQGKLGIDKLSFADFTINQTFVMATGLSDNFGNEPIDGVFGMGFYVYNPNDYAIPPLHQILGQLDSPIFTVYLGLANDAAASRITYGGLDNEYCSTDVAYSSLSRYYAPYWQFALSGFSINNVLVLGSSAITDTGSPYIIMSNANLNITLKQIGAYKQDQNTGLYTVDYRQKDNLPSLIFNINGKLFDVPPQEYVLNNQNPDTTYSLALVAMTPNVVAPDFVLGTPFIRSWCVVHDMGNKRIGFAMAKNRPVQFNESGFVLFLAHLMLMFVYYVY